MISNVIDALGADAAADVTGATRRQVGQWRRHDTAPEAATRALLHAHMMRRVEEIFGNGSQIARLLGVTRQSVWQWQQDQRIPDRQQIKLRVLTDGELIPVEEIMALRAAA